MSKTFKQMASIEGNSLMVVDSLNLAFRYKHAKSVNFVDSYIATVKSLQKSYNCKHVIIACDYGASSFRKSIFPEYKGNREELRAEQTPEEAQEFQQFLEEYNRTIEECRNHFYVIKLKNVEADDIAAYIAQEFENYNIDSVWNISSDRDWDLLCSDKVSRFSYVTRKDVTWENWSTHYDCHPNEYLCLKVLAGDSGDNIDGVPNVGPKRGLELIRKYGSAFDIAAALPINSKYAYIQSLNKCKDIILRNYELMDLVTYCKEAIGSEGLKEIDQVLEEIGNK